MSTDAQVKAPEQKCERLRIALERIYIIVRSDRTAAEVRRAVGVEVRAALDKGLP